MTIVAVVASTGIAVLARYVRVHVHALSAVAALREEFTLFLRVHILALLVSFVALGPMLASHEQFFDFLVQ